LGRGVNLPNRIIRERILTSPTMSRLSSEAERHFWRMVVIADDHGCLECTPRALHGRAYSLYDSVTVADVERWSSELEAAKVIGRWCADGRQYCKVRRWDEHNSGYCVTDDGKPTRHRPKTPHPPENLFQCGISEKPCNTSNTNELSQPLPVLATLSQSLPIIHPNPDPNHDLLSNSLSTLNQVQSPNSYRATRADEERLLGYQVEVLNKCNGRQPGTDPPEGGTLRLIARHVTEPIVMAALARMQDERLNEQDPERARGLDLVRYYLGTVKSMCAEAGLETPIKWKGV